MPLGELVILPAISPAKSSVSTESISTLFNLLIVRISSLVAAFAATPSRLPICARTLLAALPGQSETLFSSWLTLNSASSSSLAMRARRSSLAAFKPDILSCNWFNRVRCLPCAIPSSERLPCIPDLLIGVVGCPIFSGFGISSTAPP